MFFRENAVNKKVLFLRFLFLNQDDALANSTENIVIFMSKFLADPAFLDSNFYIIVDIFIYIYICKHII